MKSKWLTPERQAILAGVCKDTLSKCLQGHLHCSIPEHYLLPEQRLVTSPKAKRVADLDSDTGLFKYRSITTLDKFVVLFETPATLLDVRTALLRKGWIEDDREARREEWRAEQERIHALGEKRLPLRGRFSAVSRDIYGSTQPLCFIEALGINGLTGKPFAKVRIASSYMTLYVDLGDSLRKLSKSARRKAIRYNKPLRSASEQVNFLAHSAVKHYLQH